MKSFFLIFFQLIIFFLEADVRQPGLLGRVPPCTTPAPAKWQRLKPSRLESISTYATIETSALVHLPWEPIYRPCTPIVEQRPGIEAGPGKVLPNRPRSPSATDPSLCLARLRGRDEQQSQRSCTEDNLCIALPPCIFACPAGSEIK